MNTDRLAKIFQRHGVRISYLFGSQKDAGTDYLAGKEAKVEEGSDLDVGVVFENLPRKLVATYGDLYVDLSILFEPFSIDLVFLQETDALMQYEVINGSLIYSDSELFLVEYEEMVMRQANDLAFKRAEFEKDFLEAVSNGYFEVALR